MKRHFVIAMFCASLAGCFANITGQPEEINALPDDPVAAVRSALPKGWSISKVEENVHPWYRKPGRGTSLYLVEKDKEYTRAQFSAVLFIMPPDYQDEVVVGEDAQTDTPQLIASKPNGKVYLWGGERIKETILKALTKDASKH
jgi:hypothetical protein